MQLTVFAIYVFCNLGILLMCILRLLDLCESGFCICWRFRRRLSQILDFPICCCSRIHDFTYSGFHDLRMSRFGKLTTFGCYAFWDLGFLDCWPRPDLGSMKCFRVVLCTPPAVLKLGKGGSTQGGGEGGFIEARWLRLGRLRRRKKVAQRHSTSSTQFR